MSSYWKKCPHCGRVVEQGHGVPSKTLGDPIRICKYCWGRYKDRDVIEWESASIFQKISFYIGNARLIGSLFLSFFFYCFLYFTNLQKWETIALSITFFVFLFGACLLYARHEVRVYLGIAKPLKSREEYSMLTSKRFAAIVSLLLCAALYLSFLFAFSTTRDTYLCFIEEEEGVFHSLSHGYEYTESNVYEAQKKYSPCSQQSCRKAIYNENYKITIEERNYIAPILISLPISVAVYVLLTIGKYKYALQEENK